LRQVAGVDRVDLALVLRSGLSVVPDPAFSQIGSRISLAPFDGLQAAQVNPHLGSLFLFDLTGLEEFASGEP